MALLHKFIHHALKSGSNDAEKSHYNFDLQSLMQEKLFL